MKIYNACHECLAIHGEPIISSTTVKDIQAYIFKCKRDHKVAVSIPSFKFEILFESGTIAFLDEFYAESILSLTAAIERFHEFAIRFICLDKGIDTSSIKKTFKLVSNQSERQLGAYYFLSMLQTGDEPKQFNPKMVAFRNKVIHKGYLPNEDETKNYLKSAYDYIVEQFKVVTSNDENEIVRLMIKDVMAENKEKLDEIIGVDDINIWSSSGPTVIHHGQLSDPNYKVSIEEKIASLKRMNDAFRTGNVNL